MNEFFFLEIKKSRQLTVFCKIDLFYRLYFDYNCYGIASLKCFWLISLKFVVQTIRGVGTPRIYRCKKSVKNIIKKFVVSWNFPKFIPDFVFQNKSCIVKLKNTTPAYISIHIKWSFQYRGSTTLNHKISTQKIESSTKSNKVFLGTVWIY